MNNSFETFANAFMAAAFKSACSEALRADVEEAERARFQGQQEAAVYAAWDEQAALRAALAEARQAALDAAEAPFLRAQTRERREAP